MAHASLSFQTNPKGVQYAHYLCVGRVSMKFILLGVLTITIVKEITTLNSVTIDNAMFLIINMEFYKDFISSTHQLKEMKQTQLPLLSKNGTSIMNGI